MEAQQDVLDATKMLNINLSQEVDQLKAQLLPILAGGLSTGTRAPSEPKLSKIFLDPGNFNGSPGKKFKEWRTRVHSWHHENAAASPVARQFPPCYYAWSAEELVTLQEAS